MPTYASITLDLIRLEAGEGFALRIGGVIANQNHSFVSTGPAAREILAGTGSGAVDNFIDMLERNGFDAMYNISTSGSQITLTALSYGAQWNFGTFAWINQSLSQIQVISQTDNEGTDMDATATISNVGCYGSDNGQIQLSISDGVFPFTVVWSKQGDASFSGSGNPITDLAPGTYDADITDAAGNNIVKTGYVITEPTEIVITEDDSGNATGPGVADGYISVSVSGGTGTYTYAWTKDDDFSFSKTTQDITDLLGGTYRLTVTDENGCTKVFVKTLGEPSSFQVTAELQENDLILTVLGGTAPYSYSWSNGATTKDLNNILPGTYTVVVTDANDFTTEGTFVVQEYKFWFTKNPIYLALSADDPGTKQNLSFICRVFVEENYLSGSYSQKADLEQPAFNGETVFQVQQIIDAYVSAHLPIYNQTVVTRAENIFKRFYLEFLEKYGNPATESSVKQVTVSYALLGGLSFIEYATNNFFSSYLPNTKPFLSWQPVNKQVFKDQPEFLYFIVNSFEVTDLSLKIVINHKDGTTTEKADVFTQAGVNRYEVYIFPAGFNQIDVQQIADDESNASEITSYILYVEDQDENIISEFRTYTINNDYEPFKKTFLYLNSLGGFDTLVCTGKAETTLKTSMQAVEKILAYNYSTTDFERETLNKSGEQTVNFSTGWITKEQAERLQDFLISEEVYLDTGTRYIRVEVNAGTYKIDDETDTRHYISGTYQLAELKNYTPNL